MAPNIVAAGAAADGGMGHWGVRTDLDPTTAHRYDGPAGPAVGPRVVDWMVFDLGNVVLRRGADLTELARLLRTDPLLRPDRLRAAYSAPRGEYDLHSDATAYWRAVAAGCGAPVPDAATVAALTAADVRMWSGVDPDVIAVIDDLHAAGVRLAILSNAPTAMGDHVRAEPWAAPFEVVVISGEIGLVKPDAEIYGHLLRELHAPADRVAFTDDLAPNIAGAASVGICAIPFADAARLRTSLAELGVPLARRR